MGGATARRYEAVACPFSRRLVFSMDSHTLPQVIIPDWPAPTSVKSIITTRIGGVSLPPFNSFNTASHVGDKQADVLENRLALERLVGLPVTFLDQVHGDRTHILGDRNSITPEMTQADAVYTSALNRVCAIQTADCLPVFLCDHAGTEVGVVHAGWRSLAMGIISKNINLFRAPPSEIMVYLGPAISRAYFEVGEDVVDAMRILARQQGWGASIDNAVTPQCYGKYYLDLYALARQECINMGVNKENIFGGHDCTYTDSSRFYSYRREGQCGRMANLIWLAS